MKDLIVKFIQDNKMILTILGVLIFSTFMRKKDITLLRKDKKSFTYLAISNNNENI